MTKEDAIKTLRELWRETNDSWYEEVYKMAIDALEAGYKTKPQIDCSTCKFDDRYDDESICSMCTRHYSDFYQPKIELQTNVIDIALTECKVQHNGCKNCSKACVWRDEE